MTRSPEYESWRGMMERCRNPNHVAFARYGGRGIAVCERWHSFENFLADMGPRPAGPPRYTLERTNGARDYEPGNCIWATDREQCRNFSRNHYITADGERLILTDWAARLGVRPVTIISRLRQGWPPEQAVTLARMPGRPYRLRA